MLRAISSLVRNHPLDGPDELRENTLAVYFRQIRASVLQWPELFEPASSAIDARLGRSGLFGNRSAPQYEALW